MAMTMLRARTQPSCRRTGSHAGRGRRRLGRGGRSAPGRHRTHALPLADPHRPRLSVLRRDPGRGEPRPRRRDRRAGPQRLLRPGHPAAVRRGLAGLGDTVLAPATVPHDHQPDRRDPDGRSPRRGGSFACWCRGSGQPRADTPSWVTTACPRLDCSGRTTRKDAPPSGATPACARPPSRSARRATRASPTPEPTLRTPW